MIYIIYKINIADQCYVGSTKDFKQRKSAHKKRYNNNIFIDILLYKFIHENGGWDCCEIKPIEEFECDGQIQAHIREEFWRRECNAKLNMKQAFLTKEERKKKNTMNKQKQYIFQKNTPTTVCECGGCYKKTNTVQHFNTKKHQEYFKKNIAVIHNE